MRAKRAKWATNFWAVGWVSEKRRMSGDVGEGRKREKEGQTGRRVWKREVEDVEKW